MPNNIISYLFPPVQFRSVPRHISAKYKRGKLTRRQALILSAGLARDPAMADTVFADLEAEHGEQVMDYVQLQLFKPRHEPLSLRVMKLLRRIMGEAEHENLSKRKRVAKVNYEYDYSEW
jgi:hypothetical protein